MRARVTNLSRGARGFLSIDRGTVLLDPGASTLIDLAPHPAHDAWMATGDVSVTPEDDPAAPRAKPAPRTAPAR